MDGVISGPSLGAGNEIKEVITRAMSGQINCASGPKTFQIWCVVFFRYANENRNGRGSRCRIP